MNSVLLKLLTSRVIIQIIGVCSALFGMFAVIGGIVMMATGTFLLGLPTCLLGIVLFISGIFVADETKDVIRLIEELIAER